MAKRYRKGTLLALPRDFGHTDRTVSLGLMALHGAAITIGHEGGEHTALEPAAARATKINMAVNAVGQKALAGAVMAP